MRTSRPEGNSVFALFSATATTGRRNARRRIAAAAVATGLLAMGSVAGAGSAAADEPGQNPGGAAATLDGLKTWDDAILTYKDGDKTKKKEIAAGLFEMTVDGGGSLQSYCIDIHNPTQDKAKYLETPWGQTSLGANKDAGKILWILQNSYPQVNDLAALAEKAGIKGKLNKKTAAAGTQVAIWRFSDGAEVEAKNKAAEKLADYLESSAQTLQEPKTSLTLEPSAVSGKAGSKLGPVTVQTNATEVSVTGPADAAVSGVKVTDKDGKPVTSAANGAELYFDVPEGAADGSGSLTVEATTTVPVGRAFASASKSQTQILAGSSKTTVTANATATWATKGAIPSVTAEKNCAKGGVDVTAGNEGDSPFTFELAGIKHTIAPGESKTVTVPVAEDQAYDFTITGPNGFSERFQGVLDCETQGTPAPETPDEEETPSSEPTPASAGGSSEGTTGGEGDLAATGGSSATPMIAGIAVVLVVAGGAAMFILRKKKATAGQ
ncbi:Cys-Gln thioester bond-forming surface protein [Streptomyces genisteinicus]|uniref:Cys-Gln thioester bond-forming surface protein n=1 Tax=Streptomyces genisteinicus TaxID=2768068 RepID=A0A7H0HS37_9ACTN|nr:Cys-Gln thioester bond-forming surface protein [Streptomyces genisteinicus]